MADGDGDPGLEALWAVHEQASWPDGLGSSEGELMMVDTVIAGCITYYREEGELDPQRVDILRDSMAELEGLLPSVPSSAEEYFGRLHRMGAIILQHDSPRV